VERDRYLLAVARYIHHNPVEAGLVSQPEQYEWSSLRYYLTERGRPQWLDVKTLLEYFAGQANAFLEFMHGKVEEEIVEFYQHRRVIPILASQGFRDWIRSESGAKAHDREVPERRHLAIALDACVEAVARAYEVEQSLIEHKRRGVSNLARQIAMYVCREVGGYSHWEIARRLNVGSYSTVSSACAVIKKRLEKDGVLREQVKNIQERLFRNYGHPAT
jgi:hypothetical protein